MNASITAAQHDYLMNPLKSTRVASRSQGGKTLSYLESWDVRAHLIRIFGFGNFDVQVDRERLIATREYTSSNNKPMVECIWQAVVTLSIRNAAGETIATYTEGAVGSSNGGSEGGSVGDLHDNALKTAASDALKRCAINLGTQFGLSLYDNGAKTDVVRAVLTAPEGATKGVPGIGANRATPAAEAALNSSLGTVTPTGEISNEGGYSPDAAPEPTPDERAAVQRGEDPNPDGDNPA